MSVPSKDPRTQAAREWRVENGVVVGVDLRIHFVPNPVYVPTLVDFIDHDHSGGNIVATILVVDHHGQPIETEVTMAWPYNGQINFESYDDHSTKKGMTPLDHVISESYNHPNLGPYAIFIGTPDNIQSHVVANIGLPRGQHVRYTLNFAPILSVPPVEPGNGGSEMRKSLEDVYASLLRAEKIVAELLAGEL